MIGVLAFQGSFIEHLRILAKAGIPTKPVRKVEDLKGIDGLILPGGESTTIGLLLNTYGMIEPLRERIIAGNLAIWGTCAGTILLAKTITNEKKGQPLLSCMDITVARNAFGRQLDSFEEDVCIVPVGEKPLHCVFIRAPWITEVGKDVEVIGKLSDGIIIAARQGKMLATAFHPELSDDARMHQYFFNIATE
ncbi:MAG: pyridoxal 5'-phosphate synthase glutaminase subunit PdxT [bacterium]